MTSLLILIPLLGIVILNLPFGNIIRRTAFYFAAVIFLLQIILAVFQQAYFYEKRFDVLSNIFSIDLSVDFLSFVMLICIGIVLLATLVIARYTIDDKSKEFNFINVLIIASIGMNGIVMVRDVFSLYVFLEITAVASFILIAFNKDIYALEGAFKYIVLSTVATVLMLLSITLLLFVSGSTDFSALHGIVYGAKENSALITASLGLFICGLFIKGGLVPFHGWLPDAYSKAPASVSVLLAGIVTKTSGIYTIIRITTSIFGLAGSVCGILMFVGTLSILVGAFAALGQVDFKRMLAYSSISQVGYIILGFGAGTELGMIGAIFHLFNHSIFKSLLFVNSAAVEKQTGTTDMDKLGGLSARMPVTGATSLAGFLSVSGIPPLSGFWSKLIIIIALWKTSNYVYAVIAVLTSVLTLAYLLSMQRRVFFGRLAEGYEKVKEADLSVSFISISLALITVGVGIFFPFVYSHLIEPVKDILIQ